MSLIVLLSTLLLLGLAYQRYVRRIDREILWRDPARPTPALRRADGVEFLPTRAARLYAFQFKAITLEPILGAVVAVQFGWLAALLWLLVGVVFFGWVQDYATTMMGMRNGGTSLGALAEKYVSPHARRALLAFLYLYLILTLSGLAVILSPVLAKENVPFSLLGIVLAGVLAGQMTHRWRLGARLTTILSLGVAMIGVWIGTSTGAQNLVEAVNRLGSGVIFHHPLGYGVINAAGLFWLGLILGFCYLGATLPLWRFTQPLNITAAWLILLGMGAAIGGIVIATFTGSVKTAFEIPPLIRGSQPNLGPLWPILFITLSGGAVSGWQALVSTYGTSRQLWKESEALPVTAGAAFTQAVLVVLVIIFAAALGVSAHLFNPAQGYRLVAGSASVFANGMSQFLSAAGIPSAWGSALAILFLALVSLTTLPLVLRYCRIIGAELFGERFPAFEDPRRGAFIALALVLPLTLSGFWQWLWPLFGGANLLLSGFALLLASVWLRGQGKPYRWTFWPAMFAYITGVGALLYTTIYQALYKDIILAGEQQTPGAALGNLVSAIFGIYFLSVMLSLCAEGMRAFDTARKSGV